MTNPPERPNAGFTLIEVLLAVAITAMALVAVSQTFIATLKARDEVENLSESTDAGLRIIALIERDLGGLWTYNVKRNAVFRGRDWRGQSGRDADRIDFLTSADAIAGTETRDARIVHPSVSEVGYWLKPNRETGGDLMELWRREDPLVDQDLQTGGTFQLVSDRVKSFNITYYATLGNKAEPVDEWDSSVEDRLPRRIRLEFVIERRGEDRNRSSGAEVALLGKQLQTYVRHITLDQRYGEILQPGVAMIPVAPPRPEPEGPMGPAGPGEGPGGPAGPGAGPAGPGMPRQIGDVTQTTRGSGEGPTGRPTTGKRGSGGPPGSGGPINLGDLLRGNGGGKGGFGNLFGNNGRR